MGLTTAQFFRMTPLEFARRQRVYLRVSERETSQQLLMMGTLMAHIVTYSFWNDPNKQQFKRQDFIRLPGEKIPVRKSPAFTPEQAEAITKRYNS